MTGGSEEKPRLRLSALSRAFAVLTAVLLVAASAASGVGIVFAEGDDSAGDRATLTGSSLPLPVGDDRANDSTRGTLPGPREPPNESDDAPDDPSDPPRGPPSDLPVPNETPDPSPGDPPVNQTSVPDPTSVSDPNTTDPVPSITIPGDPPGDGTGPPDNGTGPPADPGPPGNGNGLPENRTGPPGNRTGPPGAGVPGDGSGIPGIGAGSPGNSTGPPENATDSANRSERAGRDSNASAPSVNVTVPNATANQSVSVNVSRTKPADAEVAFSSVNVTPTRNGSFTLDVTAGESPIAEKTPTRELGNATEPLAFLSVDHSISDRNISNVTFRFRVAKDRVNDSERDEIAMYRYHDGTWNELPTRLVKATESHYVYRVRSPGLSEFAAGKQRPQFEITNATVELNTLSVGDALEVQVRITNEGDADGTFTAELALDTETVAHRQLTIAAGGMRQTTFERRVAEPGTYEVYVNDFRVGEVVVNESAVSGDDAASPSPTEDEETDREESAGQNTNASVPGLGAVTGLIALLATLLAIRRKR